MHEKISVRADVSYPGEYDELYSKTIKVGKNLSADEINTAVIQYLTNTNFSNHLLYDFDYCPDENIKNWLAKCKGEYANLPQEAPHADEEHQIGTFKSDNKHTNYAILTLVYERQYLENE